jgi:inhibitor of cysteine peptidase
MKVKLILASLITILALSLPACTTAAKEVAVQASYDEFAKSQNLTRDVSRVRVGDFIKATIASNPTTGFSWKLAGISDPAVLAQDGEPEYLPPESTLPGAGGQEVWTFKALKKGTSRISLEYSQPWEGGQKAAWTLDISVNVK